MAIEDLNIPQKQDHPIATEQMAQYGEEFFLKAQELNALVAKAREIIAELNPAIGKLEGIEEGAEVNPDAEEVKTLYENNEDTNAYTDDEKSKLEGIEEGAQVNVVPSLQEVTEQGYETNKPIVLNTLDGFNPWLIQSVAGNLNIEYGSISVMTITDDFLLRLHNVNTELSTTLKTSDAAEENIQIDLPDISGKLALTSDIPEDYISSSDRGSVNGIAELDENGHVPSSQLPSYVDDVLEFADQASFPAEGESGKIYVALDTNKAYRWSGSAYVEISPGVALGETSSSAYRGDRGKIAYDHSQQISGNPHNVGKEDVGLGNVDNTSDEDKPISVATHEALDTIMNMLGGSLKIAGTIDYTNFPQTEAQADSMFPEANVGDVYFSNNPRLHEEGETALNLNAGVLIKVDLNVYSSGSRKWYLIGMFDNEFNEMKTKMGFLPPS